MGDYIALGFVVVIVASAIIYIVKQKKKGVRCIGCSHGKNCCNCSGCGINDAKKT